MSVALALTGGAIFLLLGAAHAIFTLQSTPRGGPMMPTDPDVRDAMAVPGGLGLAPELETSLFRAWIGFNLSHALGVIAIAAIVLVQVATDFDSAATEPWFLVLITLAPLTYLALAIRYWFDTPRNGIAIGLLLLWAGVIVELL